MTRKTYCGNLLWQSSLTLLVRASLIGDNLSTQSRKTTIELNLALLKITHEVGIAYASKREQNRKWRFTLMV